MISARKLVIFLWLSCLALAAADPAAEIKLRDTSYFVGTPFNFYIRVSDVKKAPQPQLFESKDLQIRYIGGAPSSRSGEDSYTFTYEAVPLNPGKLKVPGGVVTINGEPVDIAGIDVEVANPKTTEEMELLVSLSQEECYVGEPITLTFTWITNLSLNGVKAVDIRIPALVDSHFNVRDLPEPIAPNNPNAIGLPVSNQRIITEYSETERNGEPAIKLVFQRILVPTSASTQPLKLVPSTLLCSYSQPRETKFKGARYPSYFNNEFFDEDVVGEYERLMIQSEPVTINIKALPAEDQPADFSGIVGNLQLQAVADPLVAEVSQPITLQVAASGVKYPHLLELPSFQEQSALSRSFLIPEERDRPEIVDGSAIFTQFIRPERENVSVVPALEVSYFNPDTESYGVARTEPIPITVTAAPVLNAFDAAFSDGTQLKNEIRPQIGGIYHNYAGSELLVVRQPHQASILLWAAILFLPPAIFFLIWNGSKEWRFIRRDPVNARRLLAFARFERALEAMDDQPPLDELSNLLRTYLAERFDVAAFASGASEMRNLALAAHVDAKEADAMANLVAWADAAQFSSQRAKLSRFDKRRLLEAVRKIERHAIKMAAVIIGLLVIGFTGDVSAAEGAPNLDAEAILEESQKFFEQANEAALVEPGKSKEFYRMAAERLEALIDDYGYTNGELYYNLANTYFLSGDVGQAILNYRRAELYLPSDPRIHSALRYVRTQRVDIFPDQDIEVVWKTLFFWHYHFTPLIRQILIGVAVAAIWGVLSLSLFRRVKGKWTWLTLLILAVMLLSASDVVHSLRDPSQEAVVLENEIMPRKGDAYVYDPALTNPLHNGTEVRILEQRRDWLWVQLTDGSRGWIPAETVERVRG